MFWSDGTNSNAKIERSDLSGRNRAVLMSSAQGLVSPTTLVVDFRDQKLYWLDSAAGKIGRINWDGSGPESFMRSNFRDTTSFAIYQVAAHLPVQTSITYNLSPDPSLARPDANPLPGRRMHAVR